MGKKQKVEKEIKLEDILFNCRDLLRGKASMADKRDLLLTLVFLRFIGEKFTLKRREVAHRLITVDGVAEDSTEYGFFLNQSSFYDDCFYLTEEVRWETIKDMPASVDLALNLDNIISALERVEKTLRGALPQKIFTKAQLEPKVLKSVIDEVNKISQERFHEKDLIGRVYEYFLQAFALNAEKEEGEFYTPHSIVDLIASLIESFDGTIYDPCCGSGGMFVQSVKFVEAHGGNTNAVNVYGQERDPGTYRLAKMNRAVSAMVEEAIKAQGVESLFNEEDREEDIFDDGFMKKLEDVKMPNTKFQMLVKMLKKAISEYKKVNKVAAKRFEELLQKTIDEYNTRDNFTFTNETASATIQAIQDEVTAKVDNLSQQLVDLFAQLSVDKAKFKDLGISFEEKAFYDILVDIRDKNKFKYAEKRSIELSKKIKQLIDDTAIHADWLNNNNLKKTLASNLMMLLYHNQYPPEWSQEIIDKVLDQVENFRTYN